jgi:hypothetical protein
MSCDYFAKIIYSFSLLAYIILTPMHTEKVDSSSSVSDLYSRTILVEVSQAFRSPR